MEFLPRPLPGSFQFLWKLEVPVVYPEASNSYGSWKFLKTKFKGVELQIQQCLKAALQPNPFKGELSEVKCRLVGFVDN